MLTCQAVGGLCTIVFALGALRPALRPGGWAGPVGAWLLALSALGLDNVSDAFFRLDCRRADGCTDAQQTASWHAQVHGIVGITVLLFIVAPPVLAWAMRRTPGWRGFAWLSLAVGVLSLVLVGGYLARRSRATLYRLAKSKSIWERRIAIIATQHFIRLGEFDDTLAIADLLLTDRHDLIHKAAGWMLREVGKRDRARLEIFLWKKVTRMPRTMLRYAIERFPAALRRRYLSRKPGTAVAP